jgi:Domain of unknown function (DUF4252)
MYTSIKNSVMSLFIVAVLTSCNYGETLQGYYVTNQETPNFISVDIPTSFVNIDKTTLSEEQKDAYESINKLNMLGYTLTNDNVEEYKAELIKVQNILKDKRYEELFRGGNSTDGKIIVKYIGTDTSIDELIVFGTAKDKGFVIVRVLGDNMEPAKIMKLGSVIQNANPDESSVKEFMSFFK